MRLFSTGDNHQPNGLFLPFLQHSRATRMQRLQLALGKPATKRAWATIVQAKIRNQARCMALQGIKGLGPAKRAELLAVMELARRAMQGELQRRPVFDSPGVVRDYLQLQLADRPHEVFAVLFLDAQHRLIRFEEMFRGTLSQTSVYPREVLKQALALNAAAVILTHNHPSGVAEPSRADEHLTRQLSAALALIDVRVLDHVVVGREGSVSFVERGLL